MCENVAGCWLFFVSGSFFSRIFPNQICSRHFVMKLFNIEYVSLGLAVEAIYLRLVYFTT